MTALIRQLARIKRSRQYSRVWGLSHRRAILGAQLASVKEKLHQLNEKIMKLILASKSSYRAELLKRLKCDFEQISSDLEETKIPSEQPRNRAIRLAEEKARSAALKIDYPALIIGSDQVACVDNQILSKPGSLRRAKAQLARSSGHQGHFYTACSILNTATNKQVNGVDVVTVTFRQLSEQQIDRYLKLEQPFDCAGSFKIEGLGISLMESVQCDDPTSLVGLGLITLCNLLKQHHYSVLGP